MRRPERDREPEQLSRDVSTAQSLRERARGKDASQANPGAGLPGACQPAELAPVAPPPSAPSSGLPGCCCFWFGPVVVDPFEHARTLEGGVLRRLAEARGGEDALLVRRQA